MRRVQGKDIPCPANGLARPQGLAFCGTPGKTNFTLWMRAYFFCTTLGTGLQTTSFFATNPAKHDKTHKTQKKQLQNPATTRRSLPRFLPKGPSAGFDLPRHLPRRRAWRAVSFSKSTRRSFWRGGPRLSAWSRSCGLGVQGPVFGDFQGWFSVVLVFLGRCSWCSWPLQEPGVRSPLTVSFWFVGGLEPSGAAAVPAW